MFRADSGVTFVESDQMPEAETIEIEPAPSEQSVSATSDVTDVTKPADGELTTVPFLFFDDTGTSHTQEANFSAFGTLRSAIPNHVQTSYRILCDIFLLRLHLVPDRRVIPSGSIRLRRMWWIVW